jgi:hypothetical protein
MRCDTKCCLLSEESLRALSVNRLTDYTTPAIVTLTTNTGGAPATATASGTTTREARLGIQKAFDKANRIDATTAPAEAYDAISVTVKLLCDDC